MFILQQILPGGAAVDEILGGGRPVEPGRGRAREEAPAGQHVGPPQQNSSSADGFFSTVAKGGVAAENISVAAGRGSLVARIPGIASLVTRAPALGTAAGVAGRWLPVAGAVIAGASVVSDIYKLGAMEKEQGETDEEFQARRSTQRSDTLLNAGCTVGGAAIGAAVCGFFTLGIGAPVGAMIGAGIGNLIGKSCQSGGLLNNIGKGIARLFGF